MTHPTVTPSTQFNHPTVPTNWNHQQGGDSNRGHEGGNNHNNHNQHNDNKDWNHQGGGGNNNWGGGGLFHQPLWNNDPYNYQRNTYVNNNWWLVGNTGARHLPLGGLAVTAKMTGASGPVQLASTQTFCIR